MRACVGTFVLSHFIIFVLKIEAVLAIHEAVGVQIIFYVESLSNLHIPPLFFVV